MAEKRRQQRLFQDLVSFSAYTTYVGELYIIEPTPMEEMGGWISAVSADVGATLHWGGGVARSPSRTRALRQVAVPSKSREALQATHPQLAWGLGWHELPGRHATTPLCRSGITSPLHSLSSHAASMTSV